MDINLGHPQYNILDQKILNNIDNNLPKISIVTPSFNQGKFIEDTILSVIGQGYPNLEYIIIDGGSTDNTVDIIKKYEDKIAYWVSEPDKGQSHAINKGFEKATGDIIGWLNSDDMYMPNCLAFIANHIDTQSLKVCFGNCLQYKEEAIGLFAAGSNVAKAAVTHELGKIDFIIQPSTFWNKKTWEHVGNLREDMHFAFDWEWFLRAKNKNVKLEPIEKCLSMYRIHTAHKTGNGGKKRQEEILNVYKEYNEHMARLYEIVMQQKKVDMTKLNMRILAKTLQTLRKPYSQPDILKILYPEKYKKYSSKEILDCIAML